MTEVWIKKMWRFLDEYNITLNSGKTSILLLGRLGYKLLTKVFTDLGFKGTNFIILNIHIIEKISISISDIDIRDGRGFSENSREFRTKLKESHYYWSKG